MSNNDNILLQTHIADWRLADNSPEDLVGRQTEQWLVEVTPGGYGGLMMTFKAPDGSDRYISIEIDKGNVVARSYRGDEPDAKMTVAADATYVESCAEVGPMGRKIVRYEDEGADLHKGEVPPSMNTLATRIVATGAEFEVRLEWIGEGEDGDYRPDDPTARPVLRFDVTQKQEDGTWDNVPDSSYCTQLDARLPRSVQELAANLILKTIDEANAAGLSLKRVCERLSWIDEASAKAGDTAPFVKTELIAAAE